MLILLALAAGAAWGAFQARRRGGGGKDIAQYAAVGAIIGAILGTVATVILARSL